MSLLDRLLGIIAGIEVGEIQSTLFAHSCKGSILWGSQVTRNNDVCYTECKLSS